MKNLLKFLAVTFFALFVFTACSDDDDPANNDFFAGTYKGSVSYRDGDNTLSSDNGSVFVTKIASGTKYNFAFSNRIPDLNGIEFEKKGDNTLVSVGADEMSYIRIDSNKLTILYTRDGKTWTANATR
ncbi:hypothetical protein F0358_11565 [Empedobacter brevis]|uniref:Lipocalin-like domain-containing protein n=1 Tax=Empedobacter brevis NBRC 14943 = ATCC 43319 TaxID=1218108 RepID=A0A511NCE7_9FLAO|nr:hypothetical protein [Empedobacter brevis]QES93300.1 hypothetical protein F0358_11565 [Empedobacter brevis]QHC85120.1 hypothetical protein AS589_10210 [Empedobacter brevis]GEM50277.1 hypothetical protein EB1_00670 [Empedobacter brevis NBRC 14943 = ATCC 43319]